LLIASVVTVVVLTIGYWFFKRAEATFADVI
jgi:ABC-type polysaccharide/polyol phosphate export permease